jgi:hypothetical protein
MATTKKVRKKKESPKETLRKLLRKQLKKFSVQKQHEILDSAINRFDCDDDDETPETQPSRAHTQASPLQMRNRE